MTHLSLFFASRLHAVPSFLAVRGNQERVALEKLRDAVLRVLVACQVFLERLPR